MMTIIIMRIVLTCRDVDEDVGDVDEDGDGDTSGVRIVSGMVTMMATRMVVVTSMVTNMVTMTMTRLVMVTPLQTRARPP